MLFTSWRWWFEFSRRKAPVLIFHALQVTRYQSQVLPVSARVTRLEAEQVSILSLALAIMLSESMERAVLARGTL